MINSPARQCLDWIAYLQRGDGGGSEDEVRFTNDAEASAFNADPDAYAAKHFGLSSADEYREWIGLGGIALCGCRSKSGRLCSTPVSHGQLDAKEWKARHREVTCFAHRGDKAA